MFLAARDQARRGRFHHEGCVSNLRRQRGDVRLARGVLGPSERGDADDFYRRTADRMNEAGELCRKARLRFAWQLSALDLEGRPGFRAIDLYKERLDLKLAPMELDLTQVKDPAGFFKLWKGHIPLLRLAGPLPPGAQSAGVEYCFLGISVESDDPLAALKASK